MIGIADVDRPDYGDAVPVRADEIPVFWACGVTPQSVIATVKPEFCITHYPGSMLVTDRKNAEFEVSSFGRRFAAPRDDADYAASRALLSSSPASISA